MNHCGPAIVDIGCTAVLFQIVLKFVSVKLFAFCQLLSRKETFKGSGMDPVPGPSHEIIVPDDWNDSTTGDNFSAAGTVVYSISKASKLRTRNIIAWLITYASLFSFVVLSAWVSTTSLCSI